MENTKALPLSTNYAKPKFGSHFSRYEKLRVMAMGAGLAAGLAGAAHFAGLGEWLDPTYPLATPAELNEASYAHLPDPRMAMMETLSHRINVVPLCSITNSAGQLIHVFRDRPWDLPDGIDHQVQSDDDVFPTCVNIIREEFSQGRRGQVEYSVSVQNAWSVSSVSPGFGSYEKDDENGNGIKNENIPLPLGSPAENNYTIGRLNEDQENYLSLKEELQNRKPSLQNAWNDAKTWAYGLYSDAVDYMSDKIDQIIDERINAAKEGFFNAMPWGGNDEARPS